jgi:NAD(P)-dependent dehydrogenase (short-subunit alcohol dehydrogenase family)
MQKILISGGNRGIGLSISKRLYNQNYSITSISRSGGKIDLPRVKSVKLDITDLKTLKEFCNANQFHIIINNAGILYGQPLANYSIEQFIEINKVNVIAPMIIIQSQLKYMESQKFGRIINIASTAGLHGHLDPLYGATKAGLINATLGLNKSIPKKSNITVNSISPGPVSTEMSKNISASNKRWLRSHSRRVGEPIDPDIIAQAVETLIQKDTCCSGQNIIITNGSVPFN